MSDTHITADRDRVSESVRRALQLVGPAEGGREPSVDERPAELPAA